MSFTSILFPVTSISSKTVTNPFNVVTNKSVAFMSVISQKCHTLMNEIKEKKCILRQNLRFNIIQNRDFSFCHNSINIKQLIVLFPFNFQYYICLFLMKWYKSFAVNFLPFCSHKDCLLRWRDYVFSISSQHYLFSNTVFTFVHEILFRI